MKSGWRKLRVEISASGTVALNFWGLSLLRYRYREFFRFCLPSQKTRAPTPRPKHFAQWQLAPNQSFTLHVKLRDVFLTPSLAAHHGRDPPVPRSPAV